MKNSLIFVLLSLCIYGFFFKDNNLPHSPEIQAIVENHEVLKNEKELLTKKINKVQVQLKENIQNNQHIDLAQVIKTFMALLGIRMSQENQDKLISKLENSEVNPPKKEYETGPEVIINPYSDQIEEYQLEIRNLKKELDEAKLPHKKAQNVRKFLDFQNRFKGKPPVIDSDIKRQQWRPYDPFTADEMQSLNPSMSDAYLGRYEGHFREESSPTDKLVRLIITKPKDSKKKGLRFHLDGINNIISLGRVIPAFHSKTHNNAGTGNCRAMVLHDHRFQIHLIKLNDMPTDAIFLKIYKFKSKNSKKFDHVGNAILLKKKGAVFPIQSNNYRL